MVAQIHLEQQQIRDLATLRDLGTKAIASVVEHVEQLSPPPLKPAELFAAVKQHFGGNARDSETLVRQALSLNGLMRQTRMDVQTVLASIRSGIDRQAEWSPDEIKKWEEVEPEFAKLLSANAFRIVAAAIELSYDYANLYRKGKILTDIRPLFTTSGDNIEGAVISFTLRLRYDSVDGDHELSIAMDESDVRELSAACERALKKGRTARACMEQAASIPTIVTGERGDD